MIAVHHQVWHHLQGSQERVVPISPLSPWHHVQWLSGFSQKVHFDERSSVSKDGAMFDGEQVQDRAFLGICPHDGRN